MGEHTLEAFVGIMDGRSGEWLADHGREIVQDIKDDHNWTWRDMGEATGIHYTLLNQIATGRRNLTVRVAKQLVKFVSRKKSRGWDE